jgi:tryptophan-rich sensory protein
MIGIRSRASRWNAVANIAVVVLIAGATDAALRALGWNQPRGEIWPDFAPRGGTIGLIWVVLFACMGAARRLVAGSSSPRSSLHAKLIVILIASCLAYPFYTHFIHGHLTELIGNAVSFTIATFAAIRSWGDSRIAALLIGLVAAWIVFATVLVFALVRLNGWGTA